MFYYIFEQYKRQIYHKGDRKIRDFTWKEKLYLIFVCLCGILIFVYAIKQKAIAMILTIIALTVVMVTFMVQESKFSEQKNIMGLNRYKENKINEIEKFLKRKDVDLYNKKSIQWLIEMSDQFIENNKPTNWFDPIRSYFFMIIYPILAAVASIVIKEIETDEVIQIAAIVIALLVEIFIIGFVIYPVVRDWLYKDIYMERRFREDLQYVLLTYGKRKNKGTKHK